MASNTETGIQGNIAARQAALLANGDTLCDFGGATMIPGSTGEAIPDLYVVDALDTALTLACDSAIVARDWDNARRFAAALDFGSNRSATGR